jgi:hypothetical protein
MTDMLIRLALIFAGLSALLVGLTIAFAPHVFLVALRFVAGGVAIIFAGAFAVAALLCAGLAHMGG